MNARGRAGSLGLALLAVLLQPAVARAQHYDTSAGWGGGYFQFQPFVEAGEDAPEDLGFGGTWVAVVQAETWRFNRWVGARLGGFYSSGSIDYPAGDRQHSIYGLETALLLRVVPPNDLNFVTAYLIGGGGITWFDMGGSDVVVPGAAVEYDSDESRQLVALGGGGIEVLTGLRVFDGEIGVRAEAIDNIMFDRPLRPVGAGSSDMMHNLRFTVTLFSGVPRLF